MTSPSPGNSSRVLLLQPRGIQIIARTAANLILTGKVTRFYRLQRWSRLDVVLKIH